MYLRNCETQRSGFGWGEDMEQESVKGEADAYYMLESGLICGTGQHRVSVSGRVGCQQKKKEAV